MLKQRCLVILNQNFVSFSERRCDLLGNDFAASHSLAGVTAGYTAANRTLTLRCYDDYRFSDDATVKWLECDCATTSEAWRRELESIGPCSGHSEYHIIAISCVT